MRYCIGVPPRHTGIHAGTMFAYVRHVSWEAAFCWHTLERIAALRPIHSR